MSVYTQPPAEAPVRQRLSIPQGRRLPAGARRVDAPRSRWRNPHTGSLNPADWCLICGRHHGPVEAVDLYVEQIIAPVRDLAAWLRPLAAAEVIVCSCEPGWPCHGSLLAELLDHHHPLPPLADVLEFPSGRRLS